MYLIKEKSLKQWMQTYSTVANLVNPKERYYFTGNGRSLI